MFQKIKKDLQDKSANGMIHESAVFTAIAKAQDICEKMMVKNTRLLDEIALYKLLQGVPTLFVMGDTTTEKWERDIIQAHDDAIEKTSSATCIPLMVLKGVVVNSGSEPKGLGGLFNSRLALELNKLINEPAVTKGPEQLKYEAWHKDQVENHGLQEVHVTLNPEADNVKEVHAELNKWNTVIDDPKTKPIIEIIC
jgi:hypothetical protein